MRVNDPVNPPVSTPGGSGSMSSSGFDLTVQDHVAQALPEGASISDRQLVPINSIIRPYVRESVELPGKNVYRFHPVGFAQDRDWTGPVNEAVERAQREQTARYAQTVERYNQRHGTNLRDVYELSRHTGYADSALFRAFASALSLRSNGVITPEQAFLFDPFGGLPGPGPETYDHDADVRDYEFPDFENVQFTGVSIPHDTDYILGRFFGQGPLAEIASLPSRRGLGNAGLIPYPLLPGWIRDAFQERNSYPNYITGTGTGWGVE